MTNYYKIIFIGNMRQHSLFGETFNVRGLVDLPDGRQFYAPANTPNYTGAAYAIKSPVPLIHFCDSALDTLLWRDIFGHERYVFEIRPIGDVIKSICHDKSGLYQCGAPGIELIKIIKEGELERLARREIKENPDAIIRYASPHIQKRIRDLFLYGH